MPSTSHTPGFPFPDCARRTRAYVLVSLAMLFTSACQSAATYTVPGVLSVSASYLDFGPHTLGLSSERGVTIAQQGLVTVELGTPWMDPPDAAFEISPLPTRLTPGQAAGLRIRYQPMQAGRNLAVLHITQAGGAEQQITLDGRGVDARAVPDDEINFGRPAVGDTRQRVLTLRNNAETAVPIQLTFTGADAAEFSIAHDTVVPPFSQIEMTTWYRPIGKAGPRQVALQLIACPLCQPQDITVHADAVAEPIVVTPNPVDFGSVAVDTQRRRQLLVTNVTDEMITLIGMNLATGTDPGFLLDPVQLPVGLLPLLPEVVGVTFSPTNLQPASGSLEIHSDAVTRPDLSVPLRAGAGGAQLVVTPQTLEFKQVPAGGRGAQTFTVENGAADMASAPLHILGITVDAGPFTIAQGIPQGTALAAGQRQIVTLGFGPPTVGDFEGTVTVTSDDPINPEVTVLLHGTGISSANCLLQAQPDRLDFGGVPPGELAILGTKITNVGGDPCSLWDETISGDATFAIDRLRPLVALNPGDGVVATVSFHPTSSGSTAGALHFQTSQAAPAQLDIPLSGGADANACLLFDPGDLYFGESNRLTCPTTDLSAVAYNACPGPVTVSAVAFGAGTEPDTFSLAAAIATPQVLQPGDELAIPVHLDPLHPGYSIWPLFVTASDSALPHLVPVAGGILPNLPHQQDFVQTAPGKLDLLWVIDNTESMRDKRAALASSVASFVERLDTMGIDYHMGVTTTGIDPAPPSNGTAACPGGVNGGEAGRLFPVDHTTARIIDSTMPDRAQVLANNINVGGCHSVQQGLRATQLALSPPNVDNADNPRTPEPADGNLGLLREDASLAVVVVSDQDDGSPGNNDDNVRALLGLKPSTPMTFSAIVTPAQGCSAGTQPGLRYLAAAARVGGANASICDADWSRSLQAIADGVFRSRNAFPLEYAADPASLQVLIDGQAAAGWTYDAATQSVIFGTAPAAGARIQVTYREPCAP